MSLPSSPALGSTTTTLPLLEEAVQSSLPSREKSSKLLSRVGSPLKLRSRINTAPASLSGSFSESCLSSLKSGRPRSGRLRPDEAVCFKRLPLKSPMYSQKAEVYISSTLTLKRQMTERGLHTLPNMKGEFYRFSWDQFHQLDSPSQDMLKSEGNRDVCEDLLPLEKEERATASVLEQIYPVNQKDAVDRFVGKKVSSKQTRLGGAQGQASPTSRANSNLQAPTPPTSEQSGVVPSSSSGLQKEETRKTSRSTQRHLRLFRAQILDRFATMSGAFQSFTAETAGDQGLSRKDFSRFLSRHFKTLTKDDHSQIFVFLDTDKSGTITINEFRQAIEATAPVRTIEELRRRLIALGAGSMRQVLKEMEHEVSGKRTLTQEEFAKALIRVGITRDDEHAALFSALLDANAGNARQVTIDQLSAAMAAISPGLILEEIRERLLKKYPTISAAFSGIDINCSNTLSLAEFVRHATQIWKLDLHEASKAFRMIDRDRNLYISRREFVCALTLVEPSLFHEDIRRKVRQRFRSISEALLKDDFGLQTNPSASASASSPPSPPGVGHVKASISDEKLTLQAHAQESAPARALRRSTSSANVTAAAAAESATGADMLRAFVGHGEADALAQRRTPQLFQDMLAQVQLTEAETSALFVLIDTDKDGYLDAAEFARGIRMFAPATLLDDLRLRCLSSNPSVAAAFSSVPAAKHGEVMSPEAFRRQLEELGLDEGVEVEQLVDLLEPRREGGITLTELICALQAAAPGGQVPLTPDVRDARARQQVRATMAPFFSSARELRADMRQHQQPSRPDCPFGGSLSLPRLAAVPEDTTSASMRSYLEQLEPEANTWGFSSTAPAPMRQSYVQVSKCVRTLPDAEAQPIVERICGYYKTAGDKMTEDAELLKQSHSRSQHYRSVCGHQAAIERPATTKVGDNPFGSPPPP